jgi:ribonuclease D
MKMFRRYIGNEELNDFEVKRYEGEVVMLDREKDVANVMQEIMQCDICGIDTETLPNFKKGHKHPVALLQIATDKKVYLIRINKMGVTDEIVEFLEDAEIVKVGIAPKRDLQDLNDVRKGGINPQNIVDLNIYATQLGFESIGAKRLSALILGFRISKSQQTSNWEATHLSEAQIQYAATDAWVCREIYLTLQQVGEIVFSDETQNLNG